MGANEARLWPLHYRWEAGVTPATKKPNLWNAEVQCPRSAKCSVLVPHGKGHPRQSSPPVPPQADGATAPWSPPAIISRSWDLLRTSRVFITGKNTKAEGTELHGGGWDQSCCCKGAVLAYYRTELCIQYDDQDFSASRLSPLPGKPDGKPLTLKDGKMCSKAAVACCLCPRLCLWVRAGEGRATFQSGFTSSFLPLSC